MINKINEQEICDMLEVTHGRYDSYILGVTTKLKPSYDHVQQLSPVKHEAKPIKMHIRGQGRQIPQILLHRDGN